LSVASRVEGNDIDGSGLHSIGWMIVKMDLNKSAESNFKIIKIEGLAAGDDGGGAAGI